MPSSQIASPLIGPDDICYLRGLLSQLRDSPVIAVICEGSCKTPYLGETSPLGTRENRAKGAAWPNVFGRIFDAWKKGGSSS